MAVGLDESRFNNIQFSGSRSPRRQEKLPPGGIRGTRWADLDADEDVRVPEKEDYGAHRLPKIEKLQELNSLDTDTVRALVRAGKVDHLINDINDLKPLESSVLQVLFQHGREPGAESFNGTMRGTNLAAPHHDDSGFGRFVAGVMAKFRPWAGKQTTGRPCESGEGTGNNQVFGRWIFNFNWDVVASKLGDAFMGDGAKVIRLDYGTPSDLLNKLTGVSCVHDEVREVGPKGSGVYLGMAALAPNNGFWSAVFNGLLRVAGREERVAPGNDPVPIIYFGLQGNAPA